MRVIEWVKLTIDRWLKKRALKRRIAAMRKRDPFIYK